MRKIVNPVCFWLYIGILDVKGVSELGKFKRFYVLGITKPNISRFNKKINCMENKEMYKKDPKLFL
jgi:hypothetical protein